MLVTALIYSVIEDSEKKVKKIKIDKNTTIQEFLNSTGYEIADLSPYYKLSQPFAWNQTVLPYLFCDNKIIYDVPYTEAKVFDFIQTHGISNNNIRIFVFQPQAGGPGFVGLVQLWNDVYQVLETTVTIYGCTQIVISAVKWLCNFFKKRKRKPQVIFDIVFSRNQWNNPELSDYLELPRERTKSLLITCGYKYDRRKRMYIATEQSSELKEKLTNLQVFDIK